MKINIHTPSGLIPISPEVTKQTIIEALGYTPSDQAAYDSIDATDDTTFYIIDSQQNILAKVDADGLHAAIMTVNGKDVESGLIYDIKELDDSAFYIVDKNQNVICRIDENGLTTTAIQADSVETDQLLTEGDSLTVVDQNETPIILVDGSGVHTTGIEANNAGLIGDLTASDAVLSGESVLEHMHDGTMHITDTERSTWNTVTSKATKTELNTHIADTDKHFGDELRLDDNTTLYINDKNDNTIVKVNAEGLTAGEVILQSGKDQYSLLDHVTDQNIHLQEGERDSWNAKADQAALEEHIADTDKHFGDEVTLDDNTTFYINDSENRTIVRVDSKGLSAGNLFIQDKQVATEEYVNDKVTGLFEFKGSISSNSEVPAIHEVGDAYRIKVAGVYAGSTCEMGDMLVCIANGTTVNNADWTVMQQNWSAIDGSADLTWGTSVTLATIGGIDINAKLPEKPSYAVPNDGTLTLKVGAKTTTFSADSSADASFEVTQSDLDIADITTIRNNASQVSSKANQSDLTNHINDTTVHLGDDIKLDDNAVLYIVDKEDKIIAKFAESGFDAKVIRQDNDVVASKVVVDNEAESPYIAEDGTLHLTAGVLETNTNTTYTFKGGTNKITVDSNDADAYDVSITPSMTVSAVATDDDVVVLTGTPGTNGVSYDVKHAQKGPTEGYTSENATTSISGYGDSKTIKIPQITVDKYGHVTAAADEEVVITMPSEQPLADYKTKQTAVTDPTASGTATTFISSISQNENGEITVTKATINVSNKVDKVEGKGLSKNDYTDEEKNKLAGIPARAEENVQSDWNVTDSSSDAFIKNKPTIPSAVTSETVADWGFTKNTGTVTSVKINNTSISPTDGEVDLGTVVKSATMSAIVTEPSVSNGVLTIPTVGGTDGKDGIDGLTPYIQDDYWYIGETNTNVKAVGQDGKDGVNGTNGTNGKDGITPHIDDNGNWFIGSVDTGIKAQGPSGENGISIAHTWNGTLLTITSASGTTSADLKGEKGDPGTSVTIKGTKPSVDDLPEDSLTNPNVNGDGYIVNGYLYVWDGNDWQNVGEIKGPKGEDGTSAKIIGATAKIDNNIGLPSVEVTLGGTEFNRTFAFDFKNLKGLTGNHGDSITKVISVLGESDKDGYTLNTVSFYRGESEDLVNTIPIYSKNGEDIDSSLYLPLSGNKNMTGGITFDSRGEDFNILNLFDLEKEQNYPAVSYLYGDRKFVFNGIAEASNLLIGDITSEDRILQVVDSEDHIITLLDRNGITTTTLSADHIKISGGTDDYVLLAGGGVKLLSEIEPDPSLYLPLTGGTLTGNLNLANGAEILFEDGQTGKIVQIQDGLEFWMGSILILTMTSQGIVSTKFITQGATDQDLLLGTGNTIAMSDLDYLPLDASKPITGTVQFTTDEWLATEAGTTVVGYNQTDNDLRIGDISELNSILLESADGVNIPNGNLTLESGEVYSGAFYETSDARKKDIKSDLSLDKCYDLIDKCQTVIYSLKDQTKEQVGMIAQEIEEFFPEVVATDEEGFKSLAYDRLVVICFKVLKDVIKRLEKLEQ